ncbi:MAG: hypothetical protein KQH59_18365 [Desulfobulbaceae bacterium]|nr:hypothetical protein [Desulfobulbaceae bacterium]
MRFQPKTLKEALYNTIHRHPELTISAMAEQLNMAESYLYRSALPDQDTDGPEASGVRFPLKQLVPLIRLTGNFQALDLIENSLGRVAIPIPAADKIDVDRLQSKAIHSASEFGRLMGEVHNAMLDGTISEKEKQKICRVGWEAVTAIMQVIKGCE